MGVVSNATAVRIDRYRACMSQDYPDIAEICREVYQDGAAVHLTEKLGAFL